MSSSPRPATPPLMKPTAVSASTCVQSNSFCSPAPTRITWLNAETPNAITAPIAAPTSTPAMTPAAAPAAAPTTAAAAGAKMPTVTMLMITPTIASRITPMIAPMAAHLALSSGGGAFRFGSVEPMMSDCW